MKKMRIFAVVSALMISASIPTMAASVSTSEFGTFTYNLTKSGNSVTASTSITKCTSSTKLITTLEVQNNATGAKIVSGTATKTGVKSASVVKAVNNTSIKLAAFGCHEARGNSSVAKYTSKTF